MLKYAKIIDNEKGLVMVGTGTDISIYLSLGMEIKDVQQSDMDGCWYLTEKCPMKSDEQKELEEKERIQELFMTRSDFFDGTIDAWGVGEDELLFLVQRMLTGLPLENNQKLKAINNFKNALNFYRKHDLFKMLIGVPIQLTETMQVIITEESLDKYFDEVAKGNKNTAWQYLPQPTAIPIEPIPEEIPIEEPTYDDI